MKRPSLSNPFPIGVKEHVYGVMERDGTIVSINLFHWGQGPRFRRSIGVKRRRVEVKEEGAPTACRATARVARTRTRSCSPLARVLVRATLAVALRASWRTIFFPLNTS